MADNNINIINLTDKTFLTEVLQSDKPVIVDYWAEWCGPCRMMSPIFEEAAGEYSSKVKFAKLNVDENTETPSTYKVRGIPTLIVFKDGEVEKTQVGAVSKAQLHELLRPYII